jgi:hypothetical protein
MPMHASLTLLSTIVFTFTDTYEYILVSEVTVYPLHCQG